MKLNSNQFKLWKKNNNLFSIKYFLVYGPNVSGIDLITLEIIEAFKKASEIFVTKINYKTIKDNIHILADELNSVSLFNDTKVIILEDCPASLSKPIKDFLEKSTFGAKLILKSSDLKPISNLRKLAEVDKQALSIACYNEDLKQIEEYIKTFLVEQNIKFDAGVIHTLAQIMPANRLLIASELQKLITYSFNKQITMSDVEEAISDSAEVGLDDLCLAVAINDKSRILKLLERANNNDISFMLIIRVLLRYFSRILEILSYRESGLNLEMAINKLMPPVFFKQRDNLVRACNNKNITTQKVLALNKDLVKLELDCKRMGFDVYMQINNFLNLRVF